MATLTQREYILVVDDDRNMLELLRRHLAAQGFEVLTVSGVVEAIEILKMIPIDLVVTDLKMPKASGLDLVKYIQEHFGNTEVIMVTGYATLLRALEATKTGAGGYLLKPFTEEELLALVRHVFNKLRNRRTVPAQSPLV